MSLKDVQTQKIRSVSINYGYDTEEWNIIRIEFDNGNRIDVSRLQVEAFLRTSKVAEDLQAVQSLRDNLLRIFGSGAIMPPQSKEG